jgi:hypothetical protein
MSLKNSRSIVVSAAIVTSFLSPVSVNAHHGWAGYQEKDFEISGTVETPLSLAGPHATMKILVDGKVWNIVLAPPPRTTAAGLKEGIIPVGAKVTAYGHRHQKADTLEVKTERLAWGNRVFNVYPERK